MQNQHKGLSRRDFLKVMAASTAPLLLAACAQPGGSAPAREFLDLVAGMRERVALVAALDMARHCRSGCARMRVARALFGNRMVR